MNKSNARDYLPLVQAMAEGKVIQEWSYGEACEKVWTDVDIVECSGKPSRYRIKPEPREIWVNHYNEGLKLYQVCDSPQEASRCAHEGYGHVTTRYREVIE